MIKLEITTHSGGDNIDVIIVENYDAVDIDDKRNNDSIQSILIGENSYSRIDLKNIKKIIE